MSLDHCRGVSRRWPKLAMTSKISLALWPLKHMYMKKLKWTKLNATKKLAAETGL